MEEKIEELEKLAALLPSRVEWEKKSLVLRPTCHQQSIMAVTAWGPCEIDGPRSFAPVPQSFFHDKELIEAVQEAKVAGVDEKKAAADKIRKRALEFGVPPERLPYRPTETHAESIGAVVRERQISKYMMLYEHATTRKRDVELGQLPKDCLVDFPDPSKYLGEEVIQDLIDQAAIDLFEVVEVTGPAVVTLEVNMDYGYIWRVTQLREVLTRLMQTMTVHDHLGVELRERMAHE